MSEKSAAPRKRRYVEKPDKRSLLLDAAEQVILEEGYGAATARHIASKIGLKHQVVFYYFDSQDGLLVAVYRRIADKYTARLEAALASDNPMSAMWEVVSDPKSTRFALETMALANRNESVRLAIESNTMDFRSLETKAIASHFEKIGRKPPLTPELISILIHAVGRLYVQESTLGMHVGHDSLLKLVDDTIRQLEQPAPSKGKAKTAAA